MAKISPLGRIDDAVLANVFTGALTAQCLRHREGHRRRTRHYLGYRTQRPPTHSEHATLRFPYVRTDEGCARLLTHANDGKREKRAPHLPWPFLPSTQEVHEHISSVLLFKPELKEPFAVDDSMSEKTESFNSAVQPSYQTRRSRNRIGRRPNSGL